MTLILKQEGLRKKPEYAHDTDVGLDLYPISVKLVSYSGNEYKVDIETDENGNISSLTKEGIENAISIEKSKFSWKNVIKHFLKTGEILKRGWKRAIFDTGIAVEPQEGYFTIGVANSRVCKTDVILQNCVGIIDPSYRGNILYCYRNFESSYLEDDLKKLCNCCGQLIVVKAIKTTITHSEKLSETERGTGGFGSTEKK